MLPGWPVNDLVGFLSSLVVLWDLAVWSLGFCPDLCEGGACPRSAVLVSLVTWHLSLRVDALVFVFVFGRGGARLAE